MSEQHDYVTINQMKDWLHDAVNFDDRENTSELLDLAQTAALVVIAEELQKMNERAERDWFAEHEEPTDPLDELIYSQRDMDNTT